MKTRTKKAARFECPCEVCGKAEAMSLPLVLVFEAKVEGRSVYRNEEARVCGACADALFPANEEGDNDKSYIGRRCALGVAGSPAWPSEAVGHIYG